MVALNDTLTGTQRARMAGALMRIGVVLGGGRMCEADGRPLLQPTVFVSGRRGEDPSWQDVVARKV